jgi:hypothetical protein
MSIFFGVLFTLLFPVIWGGFLASPFHRFSGKSGWLAAGAVTGIPLFSGFCYGFSYLWGHINSFVIVLSNVLFLSLVLMVRMGFSLEKAKRWVWDAPKPVNEITPKDHQGTILMGVLIGVLSVSLFLFISNYIRMRYFGGPFFKNFLSLPLLVLGSLGLGTYLYFLFNRFPFFDDFLKPAYKSDRTVRIEKIVSKVIIGFLFYVIFLVMCDILLVRPKGYFVGFRNNYGDLGLHLHYITSFLFADNIPPENPIFAGVPLRYPFLSDFYSSVLWFATKNMEISLEIPGMVLGFAFIVLFFQWTWKLTESRLAGALAPLLFLFNGSMGWIHWFVELFQKKLHWADLLIRGGGHSMAGQEGFHWPNVLHALWVPQRGLQFAFPLFVFLVAIVLDAAKTQDKKKFLFAAFIAGIFPFVHGHSIIALFFCGVGLMFFYPSKKWLYLLIPLGLLWLPQVLLLSGKIGAPLPASDGFIRWGQGWMLDSFGWGPFLLFWLKNSGPIIPLTFLFLFLLPKEKKDYALLGALGLLLFFLGNLVIFAPWNWDNSKIFIFWYLLAIPLLALGFVRAFEHPKIWLKPLAIILLISVTLTGFLDLRHATRSDKKGRDAENHQIFAVNNRQNDLKIAQWIRENTPKDAIFLNASTFNHPLALTGRKMFVGWGGHVWSHGLNGNERYNALKVMVSGVGDYETYYKKYGITHVIYGTQERSPEFNFNRDFLSKAVSQWHAAHGFILFKVPEEFRK